MSKLTPEVLQLTDEQMEHDDETTAVELQAMLKKEGYDASLTSLFSDGDKSRMDVKRQQALPTRGSGYSGPLHISIEWLLTMT